MEWSIADAADVRYEWAIAYQNLVKFRYAGNGVYAK